jgi:hypothetical protein
MSHDMTSASADLVRWSFSIDAPHRNAIEGHLADLGADVLVRDGQDFVVTWDEPEGDLSEVVEALWSMHGSPFDVVEETFQRLALNTIHHADDEATQQAA